MNFKHTTLDRVLGRIDTLDPVNLANLAQRLARERRLLEGIFDTLQEGVLLVNADGRIDYANQPALRILGLRDEEIAGTILWRLVPGLRPTLETETPAITRELELTYPEPRTLRLYMAPFRDETKPPPAAPAAGQSPIAAKPPLTSPSAFQPFSPSAFSLAAARFAVILTDITRDRATTEARIEDERAETVRNLAAGVAHELGNPLNSLTIHLQLIERRLKKLKTTTKNAAALADSIAISRQEVQRLDGIITNFLEALRPRPPDLAETNPAEVLAEVLDFQKYELADRAITVEVDIPAGLPAIMADRDQLKQVFFNLIKNAAESMPSPGSGGLQTADREAGEVGAPVETTGETIDKTTGETDGKTTGVPTAPAGQLRIKARSDDDHVYLLFGDTGAGIKQDDLLKLFQPYYTTKPGGHGLGLMIVQRIMRAHGGQIGIESKEHVGTVVTLQFPRKDRRIRMLR